jgi:Zn-dependent peptidase ImmA (M78 family)
MGRARYVRLNANIVGGSAAAKCEEPLVIEPPSQASIFLRADPRHERREWAVAHELGEHAAVHVFNRLGISADDAPPMARESVANHLANRLLLPTPWFGHDARRLDWDLLALKRLYRTASHELIARRMLDFDTPAIMTICDQSRIAFRRGVLGRRAPAITDVEKECWKRAYETGEPTADRQGEMLVRAWPIHEPGWKRDILRTELRGEF